MTGPAPTSTLGDLREYPPRTSIVVVAIATVVALAAVLALVHLPSARDLVVVASEPDRIRVAGLGIPSVENGDVVHVHTAQDDLAGTVSDVSAIPGSDAVAVTVTLDGSSVGTVLETYQEVRVAFGRRTLAGELWRAL